MRYLFGLIIGSVSLWLLLSGHYAPLVLCLGAASCIVVVLLCHRMDLIDDETVPLHLLPRLPGYMVWLAGQIALSNWDVVKRIVSPTRSISPTMVTLRAHQQTELGQVIFATSITLTPGTVTVGLYDDIATVHALSADSASGLEGGEMDQRVRVLEHRNGAANKT